MIRLDILTAIARYESFHCLKPDLLYITKTEWYDLMERTISDITITEDTPNKKRFFLGLEVEFIPRGNLRVTCHSNK